MLSGLLVTVATGQPGQQMVQLVLFVIGENAEQLLGCVSCAALRSVEEVVTGWGELDESGPAVSGAGCANSGAESFQVVDGAHHA